MDPKEQAIKHLLYWAKFVCEEVSAQYENRDSEPPTWLAELQDAATFAENEGVEGEEMK